MSITGAILIGLAIIYAICSGFLFWIFSTCEPEDAPKSKFNSAMLWPALGIILGIIGVIQKLNHYILSGMDWLIMNFGMEVPTKKP